MAENFSSIPFGIQCHQDNPQDLLLQSSAQAHLQM
jgi:hypothetical protein